MTSPAALRQEVLERVARALVVDACCEACEPDWRDWLPTAGAVLDALGLEQVGWWGATDLIFKDGLHPVHRRERLHHAEPVYRLRVNGGES